MSFINSLDGLTQQDAEAQLQKLYSSMSPRQFIEHIGNLQAIARNNGQEDEREELVCRLLASGMTVEEIALILCIRIDGIRTIERNNAAITIPKYAKTLKERQRRRQRPNEDTTATAMGGTSCQVQQIKN